MKKFKMITVVLCLVFAFAGLAACGGVKYTVSFETNGGDSVEAVQVAAGKTLKSLPTPYRSGHNFDGWYIDSSLNTRFTTDTVVDADITVYAKWNVDSSYIASMMEFTSTGSGYAIKGMKDNIDVTVTDIVTPTTYQGDPVTSIGENAFENLRSLKSVTVSQGITSIGDDAFNLCTALSSISLPQSLTEIGSGVFANCAFASIEIPSGVKSIGNNAFYSCKQLVSIVLPSQLQTIEYELFFLCDSLKSVTIGPLVSSIGSSAFSGCNSLETINIPESVRSIEINAFVSCWALKEITLPSSLVDMGQSVFNDCRALETIEIPQGITTITETMFAGCASLKSIVIPTSVKEIKWGAFDLCPAFTTIYYKGSPAEWDMVMIDQRYVGNAPVLNANMVYNYR